MAERMEILLWLGFEVEYHEKRSSDVENCVVIKCLQIADPSAVIAERITGKEPVKDVYENYEQQKEPITSDASGHVNEQNKSRAVTVAEKPREAV